MAVLKKLGMFILMGAAFGLGFVLLIGIFFGGYASHTYRTTSSQSIETSTSTQNAKLVITDASEVPDSEEKYDPAHGQISVIYPKQFIGTLENMGSTSNKYTNIYADLFDKDGKFIFQCETQFQEALKQGEKRNFLIGCHSMPIEIKNRYASFKIHARSGM